MHASEVHVHTSLSVCVHVLYMCSKCVHACKYIVHTSVFGASLSEPHIDRICQLRMRGEGYVSIIHPHLSTLVPEIHVRNEMLREFRYIDMLTCVIYN